MKKLVWTASVLIALTAAGCVNNINGQNANDSISEIDSTELLAQHAQDSADWVDFTTFDLLFFELHGHVKSVKWGDYSTYEYSKDGELVKMNGKEPFSNAIISDPDVERCARDSNGIICCHYGWEWAIDYEWKDGIIVSESGMDEAFEWNYKYEYDDQGHLIKMKGTEGDEFEEEKEAVEYEINDYTFDEYGNWIRRYNDRFGDYEARVITYYERNK